MKFVSGGKAENLRFSWLPSLLCIPASCLAFFADFFFFSQFLFVRTHNRGRDPTHRSLELPVPVADSIAEQDLFLCPQAVGTFCAKQSCLWLDAGECAGKTVQVLHTGMAQCGMVPQMQGLGALFY
jgi:hypothetical protein